MLNNKKYTVNDAQNAIDRANIRMNGIDNDIIGLRKDISGLREDMEGIKGSMGNMEAMLAQLLAQSTPATPQVVSYTADPVVPQAAPVEKPKATKKKSSKSMTSEEFIQWRIEMNERSDEEKQAAKDAWAEKQDAKEAAVCRKLEKRLGLKAGSLTESTVSCKELKDWFGISIKRDELRAIKAECRG